MAPDRSSSATLTTASSSSPSASNSISASPSDSCPPRPPAAFGAGAPMARFLHLAGDPGIGADGERRIDGQALSHLVTLLRRPAFQVPQLRPGRLRIDVVDGHRAPPAPVVDARVDEPRIGG